jgi:O-antigen/teichoic acid export membrane protein
MLLVLGSAAVVNVIACIALIPTLGILGGGWATIITEGYVAIAWRRGRKLRRMASLQKDPPRPLILPQGV